jgi:hypothetical protein
MNNRFFSILSLILLGLVFGFVGYFIQIPVLDWIFENVPGENLIFWQDILKTALMFSALGVLLGLNYFISAKIISRLRIRLLITLTAIIVVCVFLMLWLTEAKQAASFMASTTITSIPRSGITIFPLASGATFWLIAYIALWNLVAFFLRKKIRQ